MQHVPPTFTMTLSLAAALLSPTIALADPGTSPPSDVLATAAANVDVSTEDTKNTDDDLPFDRVDLSELEASASAPRADYITADVDQQMSSRGVEDPFPDRVERTRPRDVWIPGAVGLGLAGASVVMGRLALMPDCGSEDDVTSCTAPTEGDIGVRGGRVFGAIGFGAGGAVFGAVAGRQFGHWLDEHSRLSSERKRRIAVRTGTTAVVLGTAGMIAGATLLGVGTQRAVDIGREFEDVDTNALSDEEYVRLNQGLDQVRLARAGLMVLVSTPTLLATGIAILVHRPRASQLSVAPALSPTHAGMSMRVRF